MLPGYDECGECEGTGVENDCRWANEDLGHDCDGCPCPTCSGVGSVPSAATVEAVARAIYEANVHNRARAALVAYAQHAKEN